MAGNNFKMTPDLSQSWRFNVLMAGLAANGVILYGRARFLTRVLNPASFNIRLH